MTEREIALGLGAIVVLGVGAQWIAARLKIPGILLLLPAGLLAGPITGIVEPDAMFGEALFPTVSLVVGVLLFEGGLGLRLRDLEPGIRVPVIRLITIGVAITWVLGSLAVEALFGDLPGQVSWLIGAILVVSGPTVVGPILRLARPREPSRSILSWEGITIDPIGATLGIVMLDVALAGDASEFVRIVPTIAVGVAFGLVAAGLLIAALRRFVIPDELEVAVTLLFVVAAYVLAERVDTEAGLFATTVVGITLANQPWVPLGSLHLFGRTLGVLIIGSLFIVLGARVDLEAVERVAIPTLGLVAVLILLVRPVVTWVSTPGLARPDRAFVASLAPRGIVAAATSSLFAIKLSSAGTPAPDLVPIVFGVIVATCLVYGLTARPLARALGVGRAERRTVVIVGHEPWVVDLATAIGGTGVPVVLVATGSDRLRDRPDLPFRTFTGGLRDLEDDPLLEDAAVAIAASPIEERNQLALTILAESVGRRGLFHVPGEGGRPDPRARIPFGANSREELAAEVEGGARFAIEEPGERARPVLSVDPDGRVDCIPVGTGTHGGARWVCLVPPAQVPA